MLTLVSLPPAGTDADGAPDALRVVDIAGGWLADAQVDAARRGDMPALLQHTRDLALLLMLFWRPVSAAELVGVRVEDVTMSAYSGISCEVTGPGGSRRTNWRPITRPALRHLCPVRAVRLWVDVAKLDSGPLFPRINRDGGLTSEALPADSVLPLLLRLVERSDSDLVKSDRRPDPFVGYSG